MIEQMETDESSATGSLEREEEVIKDKSPDGRYCHYGEKLGTGAFKTVYMAFDRETGTQLAWNQIALDHNIGAEEFKRIYKEISILKQISHESIIRLYDSWIDEEKGYLIFVTEAMTSGTLAQFRKRLQQISLSVVQSWARQLLTGIDYLHTRNPCIMHRDIKSNNIFMDATAEANRVKIGDLGLATLYTGNLRAEQMSVIGTPEYMAPEFYSESYNQLVDIWAFGLVMLEMLSNQVPYAECNGATAQIFIKVSRGTLPATFHDLVPGPCKDFIAACLLPASVRPSAAELLEAPFLTMKLEGTTDLVYQPERSGGQSPSVTRGLTPSSRGHSSMKSPRDSQVSPTLGASASNSQKRATTANGFDFDNSTTQNLSRMAHQAGDQQYDERDPPPISAQTPSGNLIQPVPMPARNAGQSDADSKPNSPGVKEDRSTLNGSVEQLDVPAGVTGGGNRDRGQTAPPPMQRSGSSDVEVNLPGASPEKKELLPLTLSVNGVDSDRISFCLCALRKEAAGVREKKVNFVFDVSVDEVDGDAQGLVEANRPEFELDLEVVSKLLALRVSENLHRTDLGRRLRLKAPVSGSGRDSPVTPRGGDDGQQRNDNANNNNKADTAVQDNVVAQNDTVLSRNSSPRESSMFQTPSTPISVSNSAMMEQPSPQVFSTPVPAASSQLLSQAMVPQAIGRSFQSVSATDQGLVPRRVGNSVPAGSFPHIVGSTSAPAEAQNMIMIPPPLGSSSEVVDIDQRRLEMLEKFSTEKNLLE